MLLQNQYYLLTHDYNGMVNDISMISSNEIVEISKKIKSLGQLFIFDTKEIGHSQTPLIINFGKNSPIYKLQ